MNQKKIDISLILRGVMASYVVFWHTLGYQGDIPAIINIPGRVSVWFFFGISGYVISHGFFHGKYRFNWRGLREYFFRRILRIFPLFYLLSALSIFIIIFFSLAMPFNWIDIPAEFFAIQWSHSYALNGVFWTLGIEIQYYLVAPLICFIIFKCGRFHLIFSIIFLSLLWFWPHLANQWFGASYDNRTTIGSLQFFFVGCIMAMLTTNTSFVEVISHRYILLILSIFGFSILGATAWLYQNALGDFWRLTGALMTLLSIASLLAVHIGVENLNIAPGFLSRSLMRIGVLAYGIYAWHGILLKYFAMFQDEFVLTYLVSLILAAVSFFLIEKPAIAFGRRSRNAASH